jgi:capsular polysaccharide transport system permease protein
LAVYATDFSPRDWPGIVFAVAATIYFSLAFGVPNALIAHVLPVWYMFFNLSIPVVWLASGILFFPTAIPDPYDRWLALNPLLQCVEWIRYSYYEDYPDELLKIPYLIAFATASLTVSLIAESASGSASACQASTRGASSWRDRPMSCSVRSSRLLSK